MPPFTWTDLDLRNPWLWLIAVVLGLIVAYVVGPLVFKPAPFDLLYKGQSGELVINGLMEILLFIIVVRVVLGVDAAKEALDRLT